MQITFDCPFRSTLTVPTGPLPAGQPSRPHPWSESSHPMSPSPRGTLQGTGLFYSGMFFRWTVVAQEVILEPMFVYTAGEIIIISHCASVFKKKKQLRKVRRAQGSLGRFAGHSLNSPAWTSLTSLGSTPIHWCPEPPVFGVPHCLQSGIGFSCQHPR